MLLHQFAELRTLSPDHLRTLVAKPGAWVDHQTRMLLDSTDLKGTVYSGTFTDSAVDRYRSVVHAEGGQTANWERNPVVYLEHGWLMGDLPIGRGIALVRGPASMEAAFILATGDPQSERVANLIDQMIMRSLSLGWWPVSTHEEQIDEEGIDGKPVKRTIVHHDTWEMLEFSVVGIPGNAGLTDMHADGLRGVGDARYATAMAEARALSARLFELFSKQAVDLPTMRKVCSRVLSLYGMTPDDAENAERAIDFQCSFVDLVAQTTPNSLERNVLCLALHHCLAGTPDGQPPTLDARPGDGVVVAD
jgi:hypothetical protein